MITEARTYSDSSARWYHPDGTVCHEVPRADGKGMRDPTLRDARKLGLFPSVTTILSIINKPELNAWKQEQVGLALATSPRMENEEIDAWVHRVLKVDEEQNEERDAAAMLGTRIHSAIADFYRSGIMDRDLEDTLMAVTAEVGKLGRVVMVETPLVERTVGYAGTRDALADDDHFLTVIDFKTTKSDLPTKESWFEHRLQTAAYAFATRSVGKRQVRTANVYVSTRDIGKVATFVQEDWVEAFSDGFVSAFTLWKLQKNYRPGTPAADA